MTIHSLALCAKLVRPLGPGLNFQGLQRQPAGRDLEQRRGQNGLYCCLSLRALEQGAALIAHFQDQSPWRSARAAGWDSAIALQLKIGTPDAPLAHRG